MSIDQASLFRDKHSKALINNDKAALTAYKRRKQQQDQQNRIERLLLDLDCRLKKVEQQLNGS